MHHTWNPVHLSSIETYIPQEVWSPVPKKTLQTLGSTKQAKASCIAGQGSTCWTWRTQKCWRRRSVAGALSCGGPETLQIERISHEDWGEKYTECDRRWQTNYLNKIHVCISMSIYICVCDVCVPLPSILHDPSALISLLQLQLSMRRNQRTISNQWSSLRWQLSLLSSKLLLPLPSFGLWRLSSDLVPSDVYWDLFGSPHALARRRRQWQVESTRRQ